MKHLFRCIEESTSYRIDILINFKDNNIYAILEKDTWRGKHLEYYRLIDLELFQWTPTNAFEAYIPNQTHMRNIHAKNFKIIINNKLDNIALKLLYTL